MSVFFKHFYLLRSHKKNPLSYKHSMALPDQGSEHFQKVQNSSIIPPQRLRSGSPQQHSSLVLISVLVCFLLLRQNPDYNQLMGGKVYLVREVSRIQSRNHERMLLIGLLFLVCSVTFLTKLKPLCLGMVLLTLAWAIPH